MDGCWAFGAREIHPRLRARENVLLGFPLWIQIQNQCATVEAACPKLRIGHWTVAARCRILRHDTEYLPNRLVYKAKAAEADRTFAKRLGQDRSRTRSRRGLDRDVEPWCWREWWRRGISCKKANRPGASSHSVCVYMYVCM